MLQDHSSVTCINLRQLFLPIIVRCCTKCTGYSKCGEKLLNMNWSLERNAKHKSVIIPSM